MKDILINRLEDLIVKCLYPHNIMQRLWDGCKFDIVLSSDCRYQPLSNFPLLLKVIEDIVEFFFCYLSK